MTPTPTIETAVAVLNRAFAADPAAIHALIINRSSCNQALADDPYVIVDKQTVYAAASPEAQWSVGMLGVLNGVLEPMTGKRVAVKWEEPEGEEARGKGRIVGFCVYNPVTNSTE